MIRLVARRLQPHSAVFSRINLPRPYLSVLPFCFHNFPQHLSARLSCCWYLSFSPLLSHHLFLLNPSPQNSWQQLHHNEKYQNLHISLAFNSRKWSFEVTLLTVNSKFNTPLCCLGMFCGDIITDFIPCSWCASYHGNHGQRTHTVASSHLHSVWSQFYNEPMASLADFKSSPL